MFTIFIYTHSTKNIECNILFYNFMSLSKQKTHIQSEIEYLFVTAISMGFTLAASNFIKISVGCMITGILTLDS